jgi:hypothetical protein
MGALQRCVKAPHTPVYSIGWPHARARAVTDSAAADFYFAIIRSRRVGPAAW